MRRRDGSYNEGTLTDQAQTRNWAPREIRLVAEYCAATFPDAHVYQNQRLGPPVINDAGQFQSQAEMNMVGGNLRRWADAIIVSPTELVVLEGKIIAHPGSISQVMLYMQLVPTTPELQPFLDRQIVGRLLVAVEDPVVTSLADRLGIRTVVYRPPWIDDYLEILDARQRRGSRQPV